jgi:type I restriction enzyme S subunit
MNPGEMMASHEGTKARGVDVEKRRLKYAATMNDESLTETTEPDCELKYIDIGNVDSYGTVHDVVTYKFEDAPSRARRIARHGDVIVSTVRTYLQAIAPIENPPENLIVSTGFAVIRPNGNIFDARFCKYALREKQFLWEVERRSVGVSYPAINTSDLADIRVSLPDIETQRLIADYLDRETARIDALVAEKEKMLALLEEKRAALISRAVTRGLDPKVPLKPSGLDWLGDIPAHWETKKIKHITSLRSGETITADSISDSGDYPVYGGNGFRGFTSEYTHAGDYVLIGRQGALCGNINYASGQFWASEHAIVATIKMNDDTFWFGELLRFMNLNQYSQSAAQPGISIDVIENLKIPVPPVTEQIRIAEYIKHESNSLNALREEVSKTTILLKERRAALITAAVTGQIPVEEMNP